MKTNYYLKSTRSKGSRPIFCRICYNGHKIKIYINESILPSQWNSKKQRAVENRSFPQHPEFNEKLNMLENLIRSEYRRMEIENNLTMPDPLILKKRIEEKIRPQKIKKDDPGEFMKFFKKLINDSVSGLRMNHRSGHAIHPNTIKTYNTVFNNLLKFEKFRGKPLNFIDFDLSLYNEINEWLIKQMDMSNNSVGKHVQIIKLLLNEATELGLNKNLKYKNKRFVVIKEQTDAIYLNDQEIDLIYHFDLSKNKKLEETRDLFILGCKTGLRFGDFKNIQPSEIKESYLMLRQAKTGDPVTVPIHPVVRSIINKYQGVLPKAKANQVVNRELKTIAAMLPEFQEEVEISITKGGQRQRRKLKKFDLISSHTARRSFCSNEYLAGTPAISIMAISGHKTERAFLRYIKIKSIDHAKIIKSSWDKKENT